MRLLLRPLKPHQRDGFERYKDKDRLPAFLEMRLGKSLLAIRWLEYRHRILGLKPMVLVVAPLTPMMGWGEELEREGIAYTLVRGSIKQRSKALAGPQPWKLFVYDSIIRTDELLQIPWTAIVLDESTRIKNPRAQVTKRMLKWTARIRTPLKAILTGIPAPQSYEDLWCQMAWLNDGFWMGCGNFWRWRDVYTRTAGFARYFPTKQLAEVKRAVHDEAIILTRKQAGLANEKIKQKRIGELHPDTLKLYRWIAKNWEVPGIECKHSITVTGWLRRLTGGFSPAGPMPSWKYEELSRLMVEDLRDEKVVVWFAYNKEIERARRELKESGVKAEAIHGGVAPEDRPAIMRRFRGGNTQALLMQVKCGKYGLDLSASDTSVYFSNSDSFENRAQSEDRIEHMSKKSALLYVDLVTVRTVDEDVMESLAEKRMDSAYLASKAFMNRRLG